MKRDIPKYDSTGLFPSGAKEKWDEFLASFEADYGNISLDPVWILDQFETFQERCPSIPLPSLNPKVIDKAVAEKQSRKVCSVVSNSLAHKI